MGVIIDRTFDETSIEMSLAYFFVVGGCVVLVFGAVAVVVVVIVIVFVVVIVIVFVVVVHPRNLTLKFG